MRNGKTKFTKEMFQDKIYKMFINGEYVDAKDGSLFTV
mgnify:CR=1 FL=1